MLNNDGGSRNAFVDEVFTDLKGVKAVLGRATTQMRCTKREFSRVQLRIESRLSFFVRLPLQINPAI